MRALRMGWSRKMPSLDRKRAPLAGAFRKAAARILGAIPLISSAFAGVAGKILDRVKPVLAILSAIAAPLFFFGVYLVLYTGWNAARAGSRSEAFQSNGSMCP